MTERHSQTRARAVLLAASGAMLCAHAENHGIIAWMVKRLLARGGDAKGKGKGKGKGKPKPGGPNTTSCVFNICFGDGGNGNGGPGANGGPVN